MADAPDRHSRNCSGPFYVERDRCISCGAPESEADGLISHDDEGHCFFVRQPVNNEETDAAIRSVWATCCGAVRYGGNDPQILVRFAELGMSSLCDAQPHKDDIQVVRNCASFEYGDPKSVFSRRHYLMAIIEYIAGSLEKLPQNECYAFRCWWSQASFRVRWGAIGNKGGFSVRIGIVHQSGAHWLLRISGHEIAHTAWAIQIDKALQKSPVFRTIRWFEESAWPTGTGLRRQHPY